MKSILLHVGDDDCFESRLQAALDVARAFGGHITCLQTTPYDSYILADPFGGVYALPELMERLRQDEEALRERVEARLAREGVAWDWLHYHGSAAQVLVERSRLADLVVVSLPKSKGEGSRGSLDLAADVAIHSRSLVLAAPAETGRLDCSGPALIAWNGSPESSHSLRAALPMVQAASKVHVVTVCDDKTEFPSTNACEYLSRHGVRAELHEWPREDRAVAAALIDAAATLGAAYMVAGAYGHSRLREAILGGSTRELIDNSPVPLLLAH